MKAVILAGSLGTRLSEKTAIRPKPMVEIGRKPILSHITKIYSAHNIGKVGRRHGNCGNRYGNRILDAAIMTTIMTTCSRRGV